MDSPKPQRPICVNRFAKTLSQTFTKLLGELRKEVYCGRAQAESSRKDEEDTTEFEAFQELLRDVLSVPKELDKRRAE